MKFACRPTPCQYYKHLEGGRNYSEPFIPSHLESISALCPSFFIPLLPPPPPLNNNNNMLLSIHHTIYRINYSLWKSDHHPLSVSITFHQEPDPVNNPCCWPQGLQHHQTQQGGPRGRGGLHLLLRYIHLWRGRLQGRMVVCQTMGQGRAEEPSTAGAGVGRRPPQRGLVQGL